MISVSVYMGIFIMLILIGKLLFMKYNPNRHKFVYNHLNDLYWYFAFVVFYVSYDSPTYILTPICVVLGLTTVVLWYQSIKNIFNNTYS